jgi:hypothetical protein
LRSAQSAPQVRPDVPGAGTENAGLNVVGINHDYNRARGCRGLRMGEGSPSTKSFEGLAERKGESFSKAPIAAGGVDIIR